MTKHHIHNTNTPWQLLAGLPLVFGILGCELGYWLWGCEHRALGRVVAVESRWFTKYHERGFW